MKDSKDSFRSLPQISVVVPALNEEKLLPLCLSSLKNQNFDKGFEVIVVNGPSTDSTGKIAKKLADRVIRVHKTGVGFARKRGFEVAKAPIIATTDADVAVPVNWLSRIYGHFSNNPNALAISGPYIFTNNNWLNFLSIFIRPIAMLVHKLLTGTVTMSGNNSAFKKSAYCMAGEYNPNLTGLEDVELGLRLAKIGRIDYLPSLVVSTTDRRFRDRALKHIFATLIPTYIKILKKEDQTSVWPIIRP